MFTRPTRLALACAGIFTSLASPTYAATEEFNPVVVSASRFEEKSADVPALVQVITKKEIRESGATSIPEVLSTIGNLVVRNTNGGQLGVGATVDMRGFGASARDNTLILLDGQKLNPIDSGSIQWELIPMASIEKIEILNGGGSVQYGDKAVGGVINIITRGNFSVPSEVELTAGSFGTVSTSGAHVVSFDDAKLSTNFNVSNSDGWRDNSQVSQGVFKSNLTRYLNASDKVFIEGVFGSQSYATPGGVLGEVGSGNPRAVKFNNVGDKMVTNATGGALGVVKSLTDLLTFEGEFNYKDSAATQYTPNLAAKITNYDKWSYDITPRLKMKWGSLGETVVGVDYQEASGSFIANTGSIQNANVVNKSYYLTHRLPLSTQWDVVGGVRRQNQAATAFDHNINTGNSYAEKSQSANASDLAFNYKYGDRLDQKLYVRLNNSYRFANIDEYWAMGYDAANGWAPYRIFSGILKPQKTSTAEIGGDWKLSSSAKLSASVYQMDSKNEIRYDNDSGDNINSPDIRRTGINVYAQLTPVSNLTISPKVNIQSAKYTAGIYDGKQVAMVPDATIGLGLRYQQSSNLTFLGNVSYTSTQFYEGDQNNSLNKMPSSTILDLGGIYKQGDWEASLKIKNILDKRYANYGGYGFVNTSPGHSGYSYYYYPADPRSISLTLRYMFK